MTVLRKTRGIPHIEDLSSSDFISLIKNVGMYTATEKLDGSQILFGLDEHGFYTSRETKGGQRVYSESDYTTAFNTTYLRFAHSALENQLSALKSAGLSIGDQVEAEVLYGSVPNVVTYSSDVNYIIFLRTTAGTASIDSLVQSLHGATSLIKLDIPYTPDGLETHVERRKSKWKFARSPLLSLPRVSKEIHDLVNEFETFLLAESALSPLTNVQLESLPLNRTPAGMDKNVWASAKDNIKIQRQTVRDYCNAAKMNIKGKLLDRFVRNRSSQFGPDTSNGGWIEGIVLSHCDTGEMVKLVDKDVFGTARINAWEVRNRLDVGKFITTVRENPELCEVKYTELRQDLDKYRKEEKYTGAIDIRTKEVYAYMFDVISEVRDTRIFYSKD